MIDMAAVCSAVIDEPQRRLTVCALTSLGIGVRSCAKRATLKACSSVCCTQPQMMSSISAGIDLGVAAEERVDHLGREVLGADVPEHAALGAAHRGADGVDDDHFLHGLTPRGSPGRTAARVVSCVVGA